MVKPVRVPTHRPRLAGVAQLDSELTRFSSRFPRLMTSRPQGDDAFPSSLGGGDFTHHRTVSCQGSGQPIPLPCCSSPDQTAGFEQTNRTAAAGTEACLAGERDYPFLMALRTDIAGIATLWIATAHHLFDRFLHTGSLVSRYHFPAIIPPLLPVVNEDLPKAVTAVLSQCVKQQSRHFSIGGDGQHALAGVNVDGSIADRIFGLLDVVLYLTVARIMLGL